MLKKEYINLLNLTLLNMNNVFSYSGKKKTLNGNNSKEQKLMNDNKDNKDKDKNDKDNKDRKYNDMKDNKDIVRNKKKHGSGIRSYNQEVFQDIKKQCNEDDFLKRIIANSIKSQRFYKEIDKLPTDVKDYKVKNNDKNNIEFQKQKIIESALYYLNSDKGSKIAILNFADWTQKGGCVESGLPTQEESICRCTTLYQNLIVDNVKEYYDSHRKLCGGENVFNEIRGRANNDLIYSANVQIIKDDVESWNVKDLQKDISRLISVITCAAPWNNIGKNFSNKEIFEIHYLKAKRILDVAINNGVDIIILGAYGCGAFNNDPNDVASAYKKVLVEEGYQKYFKKVVFAIPVLKSSTNYNAFLKVFAS